MIFRLIIPANISLPTYHGVVKKRLLQNKKQTKFLTDIVYFTLAIQCLYPKLNPKRFSKGDFLYHPTDILFLNIRQQPLLR